MLSISHTTRYSYDRPVAFGPHRLLLRPRDGHDLRVLEAHLAISPPATLRWHFDTFGNSVAHAIFAEQSDSLEVRSDLLIKQYANKPALGQHYRAQARLPFAYSDENRIDLAPFLAMEFPHESAALNDWLDAVFRDRPDDILAFLRALSTAIRGACTYRRREELGTQSAMTTALKKSGTCRDFAFLLMESARLYGFAARFVTGYLHDGARASEKLAGGGSTHAWADIYVPGQGWIEFDPTNLIDNNLALIRVAVTRTPAQATPISGTYERAGANFLGMNVVVAVREESGLEAG